MSEFLGLMAASSRARVGDVRARAIERPVLPRLRRHGRFDLIAELKRRSPSALRGMKP